MARHLSVLRRFEVYSEQDDGGVRIEHQFRDCDWDAWIDGYRLTDLMRQATAHAKVCDGKPQPKPERPAGQSNGLIPTLWGRSILSALEARLVYDGASVVGDLDSGALIVPVSAPRTDVPAAER